jgi:enediyne biosynthesis protein E4
LCAADVDGDGDLDLFASSRSAAGRYPLPASAWFVRNDNGRFAVDESASKMFASIGLVNSAVFSDLDGDGWCDLVLACEWDALKIFRNTRGKFAAWNPRITSLNSQPSTLNALTGLWQSVTTGDFDGDGRMDIVAANWGRNHRFAHALPVRLFSADLNHDGAIECFEAFHDPALNKLVSAPTWDTMAFAFPFLQQRVHGFTDYSTKSVEELFSDSLMSFTQRSANTFDSVVLLNRGDHLELKPLPIEAQFAPAFGTCVADFDGDGREDIFLAQNFSGVDRDSTPMRAGRGALLLGNGAGDFRAPTHSGIAVPGDGRGAAVADYDRDGRTDLCVAQHDAATKLYRNELARPGVRVCGATAGVVLRAEFADGTSGPAREIHFGSGWLSQDSPVPVLAAPRQIAAIRVRWPGGKESLVKVPSGSREMQVAPSR